MNALPGASNTPKRQRPTRADALVQNCTRCRGFGPKPAHNDHSVNRGNFHALTTDSPRAEAFSGQDSPRRGPHRDPFVVCAYVVIGVGLTAFWVAVILGILAALGRAPWS
jgi:hypothetical protein